MNAPDFFYPSNRLIGVELEIDTRRFPLSVPRVSGWSRKHDGSLSNGAELVLEPPKPLGEAVTAIKNLCDQLVGLNVHKSGGMHVHVQAADYTAVDAMALCQIYHHFQPIINKLVGHSRVDNHFCPPFNKKPTVQELVRRFKLNEPARNRSLARCSRSYSVINLAMLRCCQPQERSIEFRQGSVSKRAACVAGWATLMACLTDMAKNPDVLAKCRLASPPTLDQLLGLIKIQETTVSSNGVAEWVQWRHDYLNSAPTAEWVSKLVAIMAERRQVGLFFVSRKLDVNLAFAKAILDKAVHDGVIQHGSNSSTWRLFMTDELVALDMARLAEADTTADAALLPQGVAAH
jgi:hypothetical protein